MVSRVVNDIICAFCGHPITPEQYMETDGGKNYHRVCLNALANITVS